ncbi:hypothetical protein C8R44DRAFT_726328 [Mycena epipterygia]|nr:hypothetical protein C8R44DRAFT_726328 [Mycena epipterygia]
MPCDIPFFPNPPNYVDNREHDHNTQKFWFLVLDVGLFTKKYAVKRTFFPAYADHTRTDTDRHCVEADDILIFFACTRAGRKWDAHCRKRHTHDDTDSGDGDPNDTDSSDDDHIVSAQKLLPQYPDDDDSAPHPASVPAAAHSASVLAAAPTPSRPVSVKPTTRAAKPSINSKTTLMRPISTKRESASVKREVKEEVKRVVMLPLFRDDSPPSSSSPRKPPSGTVTPTPMARSKRAKGRPSPPASPVCPPRPSPTSSALLASVTSVFSISTASSMCASPLKSSHPWRDLRSSASSAPRTPSASSAPRAASASSTSAGRRPSCRPSHEHLGRGFVKKEAGGANAAFTRDVGGSPSTRLLYNSSTRTLYKDAEKAVREMAMEESVLVVDCEDVVGYCMAGYLFFAYLFFVCMLYYNILSWSAKMK